MVTVDVDGDGDVDVDVVIELYEVKKRKKWRSKARLIIRIKHVKQTEQIFGHKLTRIAIDYKHCDRNCFQAVKPKVLNTGKNIFDWMRSVDAWRFMILWNIIK